MSSSTRHEFAFTGRRVVTDTPLAYDTVSSQLEALCGRATIQQIVDVARDAGSEAGFARQVEERFVGESGFMVFSSIDHGAWLPACGIHRRSVRWVVGNPLIAVTMLRRDLSAGLFVPVELLVTEHADGAGTTVLYVLPSSLIGVGEHAAELTEAARHLDAKLETLVRRATEA